MFQTIEEAYAADAAIATSARANPASATMDCVIDMLDMEIAAGEPKSSRERAKTALHSLLKGHNRTPGTTALSLEWFDNQFPYDGWSPLRLNNLSQNTYRDYRKRAREAISRATGDTSYRRHQRARVDQWHELEVTLKQLPYFLETPQELIPLTSALPRRARERNLQPVEITSENLAGLIADAPNGDRKSLRNAARRIHKFQQDPDTSEVFKKFFPNQIELIRSDVRHSLNVPEHFCREIDEMVERSSRMHYVRIKQCWELYSVGTQSVHRNILRRVVAAMITAGDLLPTANTCRSALQQQDFVEAALRVVHQRAVSGSLAWSTARVTATHLPCILERNEIYLPDLRAMITEVKEFRHSMKAAEMPEETKEFCRALIERPALLADFGTAHLALRTEADRILNRARSDGRHMTQIEKANIRQLGTIALFCAIETGGAPIRVDNFLKTSISGSNPWLLRKSSTELRLFIPARHTKNRKPIKVTMEPDEIGCFDTITWYLEKIRPCFFAPAGSDLCAAKARAERCKYLVPAVHSADKPLNYRSFADWFARWMRDIVRIVCRPHNFRHGQASVLYFGFPDRIDVIAERLGDTIETVVKSYAWVHSEIVARQGQQMLVDMIRNSRHKTVSRGV